MLLGVPQAGAITITRPLSLYQRYYGTYIQDDWRITNKLTLNLGVRWDYYGVPYEALGRLAALKNGSAGLFGLYEGELRTAIVADQPR